MSDEKLTTADKLRAVEEAGGLPPRDRLLLAIADATQKGGIDAVRDALVAGLGTRDAVRAIVEGANSLAATLIVDLLTIYAQGGAESHDLRQIAAVGGAMHTHAAQNAMRLIVTQELPGIIAMAERARAGGANNG